MEETGGEAGGRARWREQEAAREDERGRKSEKRRCGEVGGLEDGEHLSGDRDGERDRVRNREIGLTMRLRRCTHRPRGVVCASTPNGERKQDTAHEDSTRVDLLGDRHTDVGRGLRVWRQRRRSSADSPATSSSRRRAQPTTSASPTSPSDARDRRRNGGDADYFAVVDELRQRSGEPTSRSWSPSRRARSSTPCRHSIGRQRDEGQRQTGTTAISELKVQSVNLDNSDPKAGKVPDGRHRRLLGRQQGRRARRERQVDRLPRPPGHRVDALHRRELRLRRRSDRRLARGDGPGPQADAMRGILIRLVLTALVRRRPLRPRPRPVVRGHRVLSRPTQRRASA